MGMMKAFVLGTLGLVGVGIAVPAVAADMAARPWAKAPAPMLEPVYNWTGFYIGANGGWGTSRKCWDFSPGGVFVGPDGCHDSSGGVAGGQVGYRWQSQTIVFGLEAQGDWANLSGSNVSPLTGATDRSRLDAFGLFTGQIGLAWNNALLYVKGGAAVTSSKYDVFAPGGALLASGGNNTRWGGTAGVGVEYGFTPNWSVALEYDHIFTDKQFVNLSSAGVVLRTDRIGGDTDLLTARVNYRWGGPVVAKY
jgi:outer membrane immunogenic protein